MSDTKIRLYSEVEWRVFARKQVNGSMHANSLKVQNDWMCMGYWFLHLYMTDVEFAKSKITVQRT